MSSKFKSFGNYLKHVIIFGCLYEVNILVLKSRLKSTWRLFNVAYFTYSRDQIQFSPSPPSAIIRLFLLLCLLWRVGEEGSTEQKRREGCLLLSQSFFFFFFLCPVHTIIKPSFHFGSANIAARGEEGRRKQRRMKKSVQLGKHSSGWLSERQILLYLVSGKESKQECTIVGLSLTASPPTCSWVRECVWS